MSEMIAVAAYKIQSPLEAPFRAIAQWNRAKQTQRALNKLTSKELADIGLEACDVRSVGYRRIDR